MPTASYDIVKPLLIFALTGGMAVLAFVRGGHPPTFPAAGHGVVDVYKEGRLVTRFVGVDRLLADGASGRCHGQRPCAFGYGAPDDLHEARSPEHRGGRFFDAGDYGDDFDFYDDLEPYWP